MGYEFYYDHYASTPKLTYSLLGKQNSSADMTEILTDYIREPMSIGVAHNYSSRDSGISSAITNLFSTFAAAGVSFQSFTNQWNTLLHDLGITDTDTTIMKSRTTWVDYYKVYTGTKFNMSLNFQTILLKGGPDFGANLDTPSEKLLHIMKYFLGKTVTDSYGITYDAPHGYNLMQSGDIQTAMENSGTLQLNYGGHLFTGLLLSSFDFSLSRETFKDGTPVYITLNFSLTPATVIDANEITNFLNVQSTNV